MGVLDRFRLDGQVALVTGGSRGLGLQIAEGLGEAGAAVAITARREEGLAQAVRHLSDRGIKAMSTRCDISKNDQVEAAVKQVLEHFDHIDILVNNAGATWGAPFKDIPFEVWDRVIRVNVDGTYFVSRAGGLHMIERGQGGRIINIASVAGLRGSEPSVMPTLPYNTSKAAVVNFTRALAATLAEYHITVNCLCPGFFPTNITAATLARSCDHIIAGTPLRRVGNDQDVKSIAARFASPPSSFITVQVFASCGAAT